MWHANHNQLAKFLSVSWSSWLVLIVFLIAAAGLIFRLRARFRDREDPAEDGRQMLTQMGDLHRTGGLSDEEYRSIKSRLVQTVDDSTRGSGASR